MQPRVFSSTYQDLNKMFVRDIGQFRAVKLGDDELLLAKK